MGKLTCPHCGEVALRTVRDSSGRVLYIHDDQGNACRPETGEQVVDLMTVLKVSLREAT